MLFTSATAHLMHQRNDLIHLTCFMCDYAGISFYAFGSSTILIYSSSLIKIYQLIEPFYIYLIGLHCALSFSLAAFALIFYDKRPFPKVKRVIQLAPLGILWTLSMFTVFIGLFLNDDNESFSLKINYFNHVVHAVVFLSGVAFFAFEIPQRFYPGKFDFFGQGHHWFHLSVVVTNVLQLKSCYSDFLENRGIIVATRDPPSLFFWLFSMLLLITYYIYAIRFFRQLKANKIDKSGNFVVNQIECLKNE